MKTSLLFVLSAVSLSAFAAEPADPFGGLPDEIAPAKIGKRIAEQFLSSDVLHYAPKGFDGKFNSTHVAYAIVSLWVNTIDFAPLSGDKDLERRALEKFEPFLPGGTREANCNKPLHVDFTIFGAVPYAYYMRTGSLAALRMGTRYADDQWAMPQCDDYDRTFNLPWLRNSVKRHNLGYRKALGWWRKGFSPQTRLWIDDMYMITVLQSRAYAVTGDRRYIERAAKEMCLYLDVLQLKEGETRGLFHHASDVPFIWGRGDGWMAAGMALVLKYLPEDSASYARIRGGYQAMMETLLKFQRADGLWGQLIDRPESWSETSGSAMFTYAFVTGVKYGWLDAATYGPAARKAWGALCGHLDEYANLGDICVGTGAKNDLQYYLTRSRINGDPHGQAPMMWCANALLEEAPQEPAY